jgi:hypothetical protein
MPYLATASSSTQFTVATAAAAVAASSSDSSSDSDIYADLHVAESENLGIVRHSPNAPGVGGSPLFNMINIINNTI